MISNSVSHNYEPSSEPLHISATKLSQPSELRGNNLKISMTFTWKPMPECGLDCLICAIFAAAVRGAKSWANPESCPRMLRVEWLQPKRQFAKRDCWLDVGVTVHQVRVTFEVGVTWRLERLLRLKWRVSAWQVRPRKLRRFRLLSSGATPDIFKRPVF